MGDSGWGMHRRKKRGNEEETIQDLGFRKTNEI